MTYSVFRSTLLLMALACAVSGEEVKFAIESNHLLVIGPDGVVYGQGRNDYGQSIGDDPRQWSTRFRPVIGAPKASSVRVYGFSSMVLGIDGRVYVWGRHTHSLLGGDGRNMQLVTRAPTPVPGLDRVRAIAACQYGGAAVRDDGTLWMWGEDKYGVMGTGYMTGPYESGKAYHQPKKVEGLENVSHIECGSEHMVALKTDGTVWAWGHNKFGQLGLGDTEPRSRPTQLPELKGVTRIRAGGALSAARLADGSWRLWGKAGPVGEGKDEYFKPALKPAALPTHLRSTVDFEEILFLLKDGSVWVWGDNSFGTLGTGGDTGDFSVKGVPVRPLAGIVQVWANGNRCLAMKDDGSLYMWGPGLGRNNFRKPTLIGKYPEILSAP